MIESLLANQINSLSELEKEIMYWLAINREPVYVQELFEDIVEKPIFSELIESLENLKRRSLIETEYGRFTLQNVVMEYMIGLLVRQVSEEINSGEFKLFNAYSLIKATAKDYVRDCQTQLILKPVVKNITNVETKLVNPLKQRDKNVEKKGYVVGNILNLLLYFDYSLSGLDLSNLTVWQAYLRGADLRGVKFTGSDLDKSRFTEAFGSVLSVAYASAKSILAMGDTKSKIRLRHKDGPQLLTLEGHTNWVRSVAFSPDACILASGSEDRTVKLWDVRTGECLHILRGHTSWVRSVDFNADGSILASGSEDETVKLWDIPTGKCLKTLKGQTGWVRSVAFSADGRFLASAGEKPIVEIWDIHTDQVYRTLGEHQERVWSVAFSADGKIASSSEDGDIRLWNVETGELIKLLRAPRLYEGMDITGAINLTEAQINTLKLLGASKNDE